jgi:AhpD family alkylhydroperoxidase
MEDRSMHSQRLSLQTAPEAYAAVRGVEAYIQRCGLEKSLIELVKLRASQINGCSYCVDMHSQDALRSGESARRLFMVAAWDESSMFSARERAALAWTECLTRLPTDGAPDAAYEALVEHFTPVEVANLTTLIGLINLWNRIGVGFRLQHPSLEKAA